MNSAASGRHPTIWAFWLACGVAAAAGLAPIVLAGTSGRESVVLVPMLVATAAYAGCALLQSQGKVAATALYFLAGLATLYGVLAMLAVPLRLAVIGTCPAAPATCAAGLERPLTSAENASIGFAAALGVVAVFLGFFGLVVLYRRLNAGLPPRSKARSILPFAPARTPEPAQAPPVRRIPPVVHSRPIEPEDVAVAPPAAPDTEAELAAPEPQPELTAHEPQAELAAPEPQAELAAPEPQLELAAPAPELELPAHTGDSPPPVEGAAPVSKPRRKRAPRKDPATPDTSAT